MGSQTYFAENKSDSSLVIVTANYRGTNISGLCLAFTLATKANTPARVAAALCDE